MRASGAVSGAGEVEHAPPARATGLPAGVAPHSALALVALIDTLAALHPDGEVRIGERASLRDRSRVSYAVVPGFGDPRLLVPLVPGRAAARSVLRFSASTTYRDGIARAAISGMARVSRSFLSDRVVVEDASRSSLLVHLSEQLGTPVVASLGVGKPRVNRKPVLQLFDERGGVLGFAKVGHTPRAAADVTAEATALRQVGRREWQHLDVPDVVDLSTWRDQPVLVVSALGAGPGQARHDERRPPLAAMDELSAAFDEGAARLAQLPWWTRQQAGAALVSDAATRRRLERVLLATSERAGHRLLRVSAWHGDWTPWNMAAGRGRARVWDWERFERGVPAGLDRLHYAVNLSTSRHGVNARSVVAALPREDDSSASLLTVLTDLYLVAVTIRYLALAEACPRRQGTPEGRAMLQVLEGRLGLTC